MGEIADRPQVGTAGVHRGEQFALPAQRGDDLDAGAVEGLGQFECPVLTNPPAGGGDSEDWADFDTDLVVVALNRPVYSSSRSR